MFAFTNPFTTIFGKIDSDKLALLEKELNPDVFGKDLGLLELEPGIGKIPPETVDEQTAEWVRNSLGELHFYFNIYLNQILHRMHVLVYNRFMNPLNLRDELAGYCRHSGYQFIEGEGIKMLRKVKNEKEGLNHE